MVKQWFTHNGRICGGPAADRLGLPGWEPGFSGLDDCVDDVHLTTSVPIMFPWTVPNG